MAHTHTIITQLRCTMSETRPTETSDPSVAAASFFFFCCRFTHYICFFCINETLASTRRLWQTTEALFYSPTPPLLQALQVKLAHRTAERHSGQTVLRIPSIFQAAESSAAASYSGISDVILRGLNKHGQVFCLQHATLSHVTRTSCFFHFAVAPYV